MSDNLSTQGVYFVDRFKTSMDMGKEAPHRGEMVKAIVEKSHLTVVQISKLIDRSRSQLYNDFDNPDMDWTIIKRIGRVIKHDFSQDFPEFEMYAPMVSEPDSEYGKDFEMQALMKQIDRWKSEAYLHLSEVNRLKDELAQWKDKYYELTVKKA